MKAKEAAKAERIAALQDLANSKEDPYILFQRAVELVEKYTDASAAYVALVDREDEPPGELADDEPESEDEEPPPVPPEEIEEGEAEAEPEPEPEAGEQMDPNIIKFNYADCFLRYVAATANDQEAVQRLGVLKRPAPPPEDEEPPEGEEAPKVRRPFLPNIPEDCRRRRKLLCRWWNNSGPWERMVPRGPIRRFLSQSARPQPLLFWCLTPPGIPPAASNTRRERSTSTLGKRRPML